MQRLVRIAIGLSLVVVLGSVQAWAIPAWARKYGTSCQTCHVAYPKLNQFGNAFRLLGYRMPGETEDQVKQPDVPLGAAAYKRVWPKAVWPGGITQTPPVAFRAEFLWENSSHIEEEGGEIEREVVHNDFRFPSEVELILGGTAGDHVAYFGEIEIEQEIEDGESHWETSVGHMDLRFMAPIADSPAFNVKVGSFQPEMVATFDHARRLTIANYDAMFGVQTLHPGGAREVGGGHHGGGSIALPQVGVGFEFFGVAWNRLLWSAGVVNGLGPGEDTFDANSAKDAFARVGYKWGGLAPDGSNAAEYAGEAKNWRERSFQVGAFYYSGDGEDIFNEVEDVFVVDDEYTRMGIDFNWLIDDFNVFGGWVRGEDELLVFEPDLVDPTLPGTFDPGESGEFEYDAWFLELDAVLGVPWLHGALRYETVDLPHEEAGVEVEDFERATASVTGLVRANVKTVLEYSRDLNESKNYDAWVAFGIAF